VSIIELMVGIAIAMLVGLTAAGSAIVFTASQRQGVGAGGVGVNVATALAAIKNDLALAGLGFFGESNYLCNRLSLSVGAGVIVDGADFSPVAITAVGDDDRIDVVYAERIEAGANVLLAAASDGSSASMLSLMPAAVGQAVLLAPATAGTSCLVRTVTAVTSSTATARQILDFAAGGEHNDAAFSAAPAFVERDRATLLGDLQWSRYRRIGDTLVLERPLFGGPPVVIARDVIGLRAQYGLAAAVAGSTTLETWQDATGAFATLSAANLPRVRALRVGMVVRSPQRQKPDADGNCDASLAKPQLFGGVVEPGVADWQCYRYRVITAVVPLRNLVLGLRS
jgi:type IV pilus assembly protein PilW